MIPPHRHDYSTLRDLEQAPTLEAEPTRPDGVQRGFVSPDGPDMVSQEKAALENAKRANEHLQEQKLEQRQNAFADAPAREAENPRAALEEGIRQSQSPTDLSTEGGTRAALEKGIEESQSPDRSAAGGETRAALEKGIDQSQSPEVAERTYERRDINLEAQRAAGDANDRIGAQREALEPQKPAIDRGDY